MGREDKKSYYAIITADVRYDTSLPSGAKLLYAEITALCNEKGFCWATNRYFAELYDKIPGTISRWIASLAAAGHIRVEIDQTDGNSRRIYLAAKLPRGLSKNDKTPLSKNADTPLSKNADHNNTGLILQENNTEIYKAFIDYWNLKPYLPSVVVFNKARQAAFERMVHDSEAFRTSWRQIIDNLNASKFHTGQLEGSTWVANVDWLLDERNYPKILELTGPGENQKKAQASHNENHIRQTKERYRKEYKLYLESKTVSQLQQMEEDKYWWPLLWLIKETLQEKLKGS